MSKVKIDRVWAMPNKNTFEIKPIKELIESEVDISKMWIDPFANRNKYASITNDLNSNYDTDYHLDALDFLKMFADDSVDGVLYDPPYSPRQVSECYNDVGYNVTWDTTKASFWGNHKREISRIVKIGGKVITFGWNSGGIGYKYGFEICRILLVPHGGWHNDTICTVEIKTHEGTAPRQCKDHNKALQLEEISMTETDKKIVDELKSLSPDYWDFKEEDTKEYTHGIHNYPAMMVSPISRNIIRLMSKYTQINSLLDPFAGSGTVLVEGMLAGVKRIAGNDINPLALFISKVKTTKLNTVDLQQTVDVLIQSINRRTASFNGALQEADKYVVEQCGLDCASKDGWGIDAFSILNEYCQQKQIDLPVPNFKNMGYWFKPQVILILSLIKDEILKISNDDIRDFVLVAFSDTIRLVSNRRNGEFKMYRMPADKVRDFYPDVITEFTETLARNTGKMNEFTSYLDEANTFSEVTIYKNNTCDLKDVPDEQFDLIITSPPYGDSRTTVAYGEYSRLSLQWLDIFELSEKEIMAVDRTLMGGKKYHNGFEFTIESPTLMESLSRIKDVDIERAGDVFSFYKDLDASIKSIAQKTKKGGYHFWVVGNRTVKGELLKTDEIIREIAVKYGLHHIYSIERNIPNKVMPSLNSPSNQTGKTASTMTMEHIVILRKQ